MRIAIAAAILALAACQPAEEASAPTPEEMGQDDPAAPPEAAPDPTPVKFAALSKTAEAFTGDVSLSAQPRSGPNAAPRMKIEAATGLVYETELMPGGAGQASAVDWKSIFNADVATDANPPRGAPSIDMHSVISEAIPPAAPNGGLCGADKTTFIAMASGLNVAGTDIVSLAAFKGAQWPPANASALCGTFNYAPPARQ